MRSDDCRLSVDKELNVQIRSLSCRSLEPAVCGDKRCPFALCEGQVDAVVNRVAESNGEV
jgi:hypothetical protein